MQSKNRISKSIEKYAFDERLTGRHQYASTTIVAAITTTIKKYPVTVLIPKGNGGLKESSMNPGPDSNHRQTKD
jgi:hypothetical protein